MTLRRFFPGFTQKVSTAAAASSMFSLAGNTTTTTSTAAMRSYATAGKKDAYAQLGINKNATPEEIKSAYKKKAKKLHPDVNPSPKAADEFAEVKQAYDVLSDPQKRSMYDMTGNQSQADQFGGMGGGGGPGGFNPFQNMQGGSQAGGNNPFQNMGGQGGGNPGNFNFSDFEEMFSKMSGGEKQTKAAKPQGPEPGADIHFALKLSFLEAVNGCSKEIAYNTFRRCQSCTGSGQKETANKSKCPHCNGRGKKTQSTGFFHMNIDCTHCSGTGELGKSSCAHCTGKGVVKDRSVQTLPVPKGVNSKERLKVTGKGEAGVRNGPPGNLLVEIKVDDHPVFHRDGLDIHVIAPVTLSTAILGGTIRIKTLSGEVETRVPPGTQQGDRLLLRGRGVHRPNVSKTGDFFIHFAVMLPKELTEDQKKAVAEFAKDETPVNLSDPQLQQLKDRYRSWFTQGN